MDRRDDKLRVTAHYKRSRRAAPPPDQVITGELRDSRFDKGNGYVTFDNAVVTRVSFHGLRFGSFAATASILLVATSGA